VFPLVRGGVVGATGFEPVTPSVSGTRGGLRPPAAGGGVCPVTWANGGPLVTVVVRCGPVDRGRMWPRCGPALPSLEGLSSVTCCLSAADCQTYSEHLVRLVRAWTDDLV
jgi:hypothetical protein